MIRIENLHRDFNGVAVLKGLSLSIETGKTYAIIGRSGCGKSVLLKHIMGLLKPDSGNIYVNGIDITQLNEKELDKIRLQFGLVFQGAALFDSLTVEENVGFLLYEYSDMKRTQIREKVKYLLRLVGLANIEDKYPEELSGGMRKRVAIARALCLNPTALLYDEPTTGVDPIGADMINTLMKNLHDKLGVTSIVVTHDMSSAFRIADRILMLFGGKIIFDGTPEEIKTSTDERVVQFIEGRDVGPISQVEV